MLLSFLLLFLGYILFQFFKRRQVLKGIIAGGLVMILSISAVLFIPALKSRFTELLTSSYSFKNDPANNKYLSGKLDGIRMRLAKWQFSIQAGKSVPWFGQGTGDDEDALLRTYLENNFMEGYVPKFNSHNQYLQTWLALGLFGLVILLLSIIVSFVLAIRQRSFLYLVFLVSMTLFLFTESVFERQAGVVFFAFFNSLFAFQKPHSPILDSH